jgi:hypothetical protein
VIDHAPYILGMSMPNQRQAKAQTTPSGWALLLIICCDQPMMHPLNVTQRRCRHAHFMTSNMHSSLTWVVLCACLYTSKVVCFGWFVGAHAPAAALRGPAAAPAWSRLQRLSTQRVHLQYSHDLAEGLRWSSPSQKQSVQELPEAQRRDRRQSGELRRAGQYTAGSATPYTVNSQQSSKLVTARTSRAGFAAPTR